MPKLTVVDRSGTERTIEVGDGLTVMEAIRDNGFDELLAALRKVYKGDFILAGGLDGDSAAEALDSGLAQFAAFGRPYIANPDLVARLQAGAPLNQVNPRTLYGGGAEGYTDYPAM